MTLYHPDSLVSRLTPREAERERTRAIDTAVVAARLTRSAALLASHGT